MEEKKRESDEMGRVRLCRKTPLFVSLLLLFLSLLPAPPTPSPPSRLSLFLSNHLIQTSRTLHTKKNADELADNTTYFSSGDKTAVPAAPNPRPPFISEKPFPLILCLRQLLFLHPLHASTTPSEFSSFVFFLFFFSSPLSLFCLFSSGKNTRVLTRAIFPFSWSARENPIVSDGSVCAEGDWESSPLCARARLVRERGGQRARKVGVGFVFFLPDLFHHPKLFPYFLDSYSTFYSAFSVFQMHFTIANKLILTLAGTGSGVGREVESEMKQKSIKSNLCLPAKLKKSNRKAESLSVLFCFKGSRRCSNATVAFGLASTSSLSLKRRTRESEVGAFF